MRVEKGQVVRIVTECVRAHILALLLWKRKEKFCEEQANKVAVHGKAAQRPLASSCRDWRRLKL